MLNYRHLDNIVLHYITRIPRRNINHCIHATNSKRQGPPPVTLLLRARYFRHPITNVAISITRHIPLLIQAARLVYSTLRINPLLNGNN